MRQATKYRVKLRREGFPPIKPNAEQVDGKVYLFKEMWDLSAEDTSIYVGETAMMPTDEDWPIDAPSWLASGDLIPERD